METRKEIFECLKAARLIYTRGLVNAYEGNVSVRVGNSVWITPSQVCKEDLTPDDLVEVSLETGEVLSAHNGRKPSSEVKLHLCCYRSRDDIGAVAHTHSPYATSFAVRCEPIETNAYPEMILLYGKAPVCRYGRPSTEAVNADVPEVLKKYDVFLLANHGVVSVADNAMDAVYRIEGIESIAKVLHTARMRGGECALPDGEAEAIEEIRLQKRGYTGA